MSKTIRLQKEIADSDDTKRELQQKITKLEAQKSRLEQVFKATMKSGTSDLVDEVQLLIRRIEFLEE
jgi:ferritin-like metal-binding protein YciE